MNNCLVCSSPFIKTHVGVVCANCGMRPPETSDIAPEGPKAAEASATVPEGPKAAETSTTASRSPQAADKSGTAPERSGTVPETSGTSPIGSGSDTPFTRLRRLADSTQSKRARPYIDAMEDLAKAEPGLRVIAGGIAAVGEFAKTDECRKLIESGRDLLRVFKAEK